MARQHSQYTTPQSQPRSTKSGNEQHPHRQSKAGISNRPTSEEHLQQEKLPPPGKAKKGK